MGRVEYLNDPAAPRPNSLVPAAGVLAVDVLAVDERGRMLLQRRRDTGQWAIPMGKQELGETVAQCAIRETLEETGVTVEVTGLLDIYSDPAHIVAYTDGEVRQEYEVILLGRPVSGEPTANDEASAAGWFTRGNCSSWTSTRRSGGSSATGWTGRTRASTSALRSADYCGSEPRLPATRRYQ